MLILCPRCAAEVQLRHRKPVGVVDDYERLVGGVALRREPPDLIAQAVVGEPGVVGSGYEAVIMTRRWRCPVAGARGFDAPWCRVAGAGTVIAARSCRRAMR